MSASPEGFVRTSRDARIPPRGALRGVPSPPPVTFTSIVGTRADLDVMIGRWEHLAGAVLAGLQAPRVLLHPGEEGTPRGDPADLRVAVLEHPAGLAGAIAPALRQFAAATAAERVDVDPGYWLAPAAGSAPGSLQAGMPPRWTTAWNEDHRAAVQSFPAPEIPDTVAGGPAARHRNGPARVLLVDTGDLRANRQDAFLIRQINTPDLPPQDWHGHGTSLGDLIRLRAPEAAVTALRVFEPESEYSASPALLAALNWALHPVSGAEVVCVAQRAVVSDDHGEHAAVILSILRRAVTVGFPLPVVVCAVGNSRRKRGRELMSLPATAPGVLAARAVGWRGKPLDYNCRPPLGTIVNIVDAYGGEERDPIGVTMAPPDAEVWMVGSSYAAALVAGALAAG